MAKQRREEEPVAASLNPRDMLAGGLRDDFRARVVAATYARWDYDGAIDEPVLAGKLTLQPLDENGEVPDGDEGEPFDQHWSAGDLAAFVPSQDGRTPCEEDEEGPFAVKVGKRAQLNNNTNWAHLITTIVDSGTAAKGKPFTEKDLSASAECFVGLDAHWNRVPQKKRAGLVDDDEGGEKKRGRDVLVVTDVYGYGEAEAAPKKKVKPNGAAGKPTSVKSRREEPEEDEEDEAPEVSPLDAKLEEIVAEALEDAGGKLKKGKLAQLILNAMAKDKDKSKGVKRVTEPDFLEDEARPWDYDEDTGVLKAKADDEEEEEEEEEE